LLALRIVVLNKLSTILPGVERGRELDELKPISIKAKFVFKAADISNAHFVLNCFDVCGLGSRGLTKRYIGIKRLLSGEKPILAVKKGDDPLLLLHCSHDTP